MAATSCGSALALQAFEKRFGRKQGRRSWRDFRSKNDPEAPTTILKKRFPYQTTGPFAKRGLALPDPGSVKLAPVAPAVVPEPSTAKKGLASVGEQLHRALTEPAHASNWLLVSARESASGHPIAVMGPQVGYYVPQILMELDLHGPGIDARGATFPGVNLYVQLGHGRDYAWSATTATSDNVDTFAEVLCQDDFHYMYKGECRADGEAGAQQHLAAQPRRRHRRRLGDADRVPDRPRHRLRARDREGQEGGVHVGAHDLLPRGRLGARASRT